MFLKNSEIRFCRQFGCLILLYLKTSGEVLGSDLDLSLRFVVFKLSMDGKYSRISVLLLNLIENPCYGLLNSGRDLSKTE